MNDSIKNILSCYNTQQLDKIKDFLLSEIDDDNVQETIDFVISNDSLKKEKYKNILYHGNVYEGLFIEGNQYLIGSNQTEVIIIDIVSENNGVNKNNTRINMTIKDFITLISNKKEVIAKNS